MIPKESSPIAVKYYNWLVKQLINFNHYGDSLKVDCRAYAGHYFDNIDEEEYNYAWEWALADTFGNGCEYEVY
jgi:hypothetical protein